MNPRLVETAVILLLHRDLQVLQPVNVIVEPTHLAQDTHDLNFHTIYDTPIPLRVNLFFLGVGSPFKARLLLRMSFWIFRFIYRFICLLATYTKAGFYVNTKTEALLELSRETNRFFSEITCIKISTNFS